MLVDATSTRVSPQVPSAPRRASRGQREARPVPPAWRDAVLAPRAPGRLRALARPPHGRRAWTARGEGRGEPGTGVPPPPARVAAGRAAPAPAVRQRLLTQKRLSAPQPPARVVPMALAPSRPCRLVIGVYLWSVWCTWGSGDALESQRRADRDGCLQTGDPVSKQG